MAKKNDNRRNDSSGSSSKWTTGHNGENEDKRAGNRKEPNLKRKDNTNKGKNR